MAQYFVECDIDSRRFDGLVVVVFRRAQDNEEERNQNV